MRPSSWWLLALVGCRGLDRVPVLEGEQCAAPRLANVACVVDGDTLDLEYCGGERVRLLGIQAPEIAHSAGETDECYGPEATERLSLLAQGRAVELRFDSVCADAYGRTLAYVYLLPEDENGDDGTMLANERMVLEGYAKVYEDFDDIALAERLYAAEADARDGARGLWSECAEGA